MKTSPIILALVCMSAPTARAEWLYNKSTNPLTDNEIHVFLCPPTNITQKVELQKPVAIAIQITNGKPTVAIIARPDFTTERTYPVTIRFDRKKAREISCIISNDRDMLFPIKQKDFMEEILSSDGLIISLDALLGHRMDFFDLRGLDAELKKHNLELFQTQPEPPQEPPPEPRDDPAVVEARKAKAARAYSKPLPDICEEIAKRTREHAQNKLNPKKLTLLDLQRRSHKLGTVWIQRFNADGKNWRTGFLHSSGILSQIAPKSLQTYIDESTPED